MMTLSKIHLTVNIWAKKGLTSSYIEVTAQFLRKEKNVGTEDVEIVDLVLELIEFPPPHTGLRIAVELLRVIKEWGILDRVGFVLTDSGSNMIRLFKEAKLILEKQAKEDEKERDNNNLLLLKWQLRLIL